MTSHRCEGGEGPLFLAAREQKDGNRIGSIAV
jgi:hypothetical protein